MTFIKRIHITPALVISLLALFVALGGVSWAAVKLPKNSVGSSQIKKNAVTGAKVKDGSLAATDLSPAAQEALRGNSGPQGPQGSQGLQGAQGPQGPAGGFDANKVVYRVSAETPIDANSVGSTLSVSCASNEKAISGGFEISDADDGTSFAWSSIPAPSINGWSVSVDNTGGAAGSGYAFVVCGVVG